MRIETKRVSDLEPAPYNPRVELKPGMPGYERLRRSLEEFDLVQPLVWNRRTGFVVGGHQRLSLLKDRGQTEVDCVVVDLPDERERALNVALNNEQVGGEWDTGKLLELLDGLRADGVDATLTGFSAEDLTEMLMTPAADFAPPEPEPPADAAVELSVEVPPARWSEVKTWVDSLLAAEPEVRVHVRGGSV